MPFNSESEQPALGLAHGPRLIAPPPPEIERPGLGEIYAAAFQRENLPGALLLADKYIQMRDNDFQEPGFDPIERIAHTKYARYEGFFADVQNSRALVQRQSYVDALEANDDVLQRGGGEAVLAAIVSSFLDPINFIPVGGAGLANRMRTLPSLIRKSAQVGGIAAAAQELPLKQLQPNRSWGEVAANVTGSAILSGALGGAIGRFARRFDPPDLDIPALVDVSRKLRGLDATIQDLVRKGATEEDILEALSPTLAAARERSPATGAQMTRHVQAVAPDLAEGRITIDDVVEHALQRIPTELDPRGTIADVQASIDNAMRQSRMDPMKPLRSTIQSAEGLPDWVRYRPQPERRVVGFHTAAGEAIEELDGLVDIQLDLPASHARTNGFVHGIDMDLDHVRVFDPDDLLEGTVRLEASEKTRILDRLQRERNIRQVLEEEGFDGYVYLIDTPNGRTRELAVVHGPPLRKTGLTMRFSEIGGFTHQRLLDVEQRLGLHRVPVAGGMQGVLLSFDGRLARTTDEMFEEANNPYSLFSRLGNAERMDGRIDVNTATMDDLLSVPGIGPARARQILDHLSTRQPIDDLDELLEVPGLGRQTLDRIRDRLDTRQQVFRPAQDTQMASAFGFEKILGRINPNTRVLATSKSGRMKLHMLRLFEAGGVALSTDGHLRQPLSVETLAKQYNRALDVYTRQQWDLFLQYRQRMLRTGPTPRPEDIEIGTQTRLRGAGRILRTEFEDLRRNWASIWDAEQIPMDNGPLTYTEFRRRVGMATYMGGKDVAATFRTEPGMEFRIRQADPIPEVERAATALKAEILDPMLADMRELGLIIESDLNAVRNVSDGYFHRAYIDEKVKAEQHQMVNRIADYYVGERGFDVESAVRIAENQVQKLLEVPVGRTPYDLSRRNVSAAIRTRHMDIPDRVLMPWLETDTDAILRMYLKTVGPDIEMARYLRSVRRERVRTSAVHHVMEAKGLSEGKAGDFVLRAEERLDALEPEYLDVTERLLAMRREAGGGAAGGDDPGLTAQLMRNRDFVELQKRANQIRTEINRIHEDLGPEFVQKTISSESGMATRLAEGRSRYDTHVGEKEPLDLTPILDDINDDYTRVMNQAIRDAGADITTNQASVNQIVGDLQALKERDLRILHQLTDMLRNNHVHPIDDLFGVGPTRLMRGLRRWNVLTMAGGFMISSIPDIGRLMMIDGMSRFYGDILDPLISDFRITMDGIQLGPKSRKLRSLQLEIDDLGVTFETVLNNRASLITEVQRRMPTTKLETMLERGADMMFLVNGMSLWNDMLKEVVAIQTYLKIARAAREVSAGRALPDELLKKLNRLGLEPRQLKRIWQQIEHGARPARGAEIPADRILTDGIPITRFSQWDDPELRQLLRAVLQREADNLIITPGVGDKPLLMSAEVAKTIGQFKSFAFAATSRLTLASLQGLNAKEAHVLQQLAVMHFLGMMTWALKTLQYGGDFSKYTVNDIVAEGVDRSGMPAILSEVDGLLSALSGGTLSAARLIGARPPSRFIARRQVPRMLLGPTYSRVEAASDLIDAIVNLDMKPRDVRHIRNQIFLSNYFVTDPLFDLVENAGKAAVRNRPVRKKQDTGLGPTMEIEGEQGVPLMVVRDEKTGKSTLLYGVPKRTEEPGAVPTTR